ncbi:DMT family transporter [Shimia sagamensis]|uniref:EamA-like transporter family protein n=1 Tax=Shimia sagamensis TaxID=1566352 RepID=A0ABY1P1J8_9RHOB|nr:DMT family transporter [Shimia sagamensis]SMP23687.1 EamA-like transporter family protein [Shimia sagamensis]
MQNVHGILILVAAMLGFTLEDMFIKSLSVTIPVGQILMALGLGSGAVFAVLAIMRGDNLFAPAAWSPRMLLRTSCEAGGAVLFATALSRVDLSTVAAVFQTLPLVITLGAALFLSEQVGWRRLTAILVGFTGVLLIIRPGTDAFDPNALLVLGAVLAVAIRDLITRTIDASVSSFVVSFQSFASLVLAGPLLMLFNTADYTELTTSHLTMMAGAVAFGAAGYWGVVTALRLGEASVVAPFRYSRLLFSILVGMVAFGERPDLPTMLGATLIIGSGLFTFMREHRLAKATAPAQA